KKGKRASSGPWPVKSRFQPPRWAMPSNWNITSPGTSPLVIRSARESNCTPNSDSTLRTRAARPSKKSKNIPMATKRAAHSKWFRAAKTTATQPLNRLSMVKKFGINAFMVLFFVKITKKINCWPQMFGQAVIIMIFAPMDFKNRPKALPLILFLLLGTMAFSQGPLLTERSQISMLTCGAGDELYSSFGHTAFRVQDPNLGLDVVYNYGTFDFDRPNFYLNFVKGRMIYSLSRSNFDDFLFEYELGKRWVKEQLLDLNLEQRNRLLAFFEENYKPLNRDYLYDPLLNNCSSISGTILKEQFGDTIVFGDAHLERRYSFRQLVRQFLKANSWSMVGIDLAFGAVVDRKATLQEHMFMPYYAMEQLRHTRLGEGPLLKRERTILDYREHPRQSFFPLSPLFWSLILLAFTLVITYFDHTHKTRSRWLDFGL